MNPSLLQHNLPRSYTQPHPLIRRRSLLKGLGAIALAQMMAGCSNRQVINTSIQFLQSSMPTALLREFQRAHADLGEVEFRPVETLSALYDNLLSWQNASTTTVATGITLGDYWLTTAIRQGLIEPINVQEMDGWDKLPQAWKDMITRDRQGIPSTNGLTWGAPYRGGTLVIAYQIEVFEDLGWTPSNWEDLWNPDVNGHLSLLDSPRAVIGLTLRRLGESFNAEEMSNTALTANTDLKQALRSLHTQVKLYSSSAYLQPLILGDTWMAVGWSTDILPLLRRDRRFAAVVPKSGTALTADIWVRPIQPEDSNGESEEAALHQTSVLKEWIQFCWQPDIAQRLSIQSLAASPVLMAGDRVQLPESLRNDTVLLPEPSVLEQSEFLMPLSSPVLEEYEKLWTDMRLGTLG